MKQFCQLNPNKREDSKKLTANSALELSRKKGILKEADKMASSRQRREKCCFTPDTYNIDHPLDRRADRKINRPRNITASNPTRFYATRRIDPSGLPCSLWLPKELQYTQFILIGTVGF